MKNFVFKKMLKSGQTMKNFVFKKMLKSGQTMNNRQTTLREKWSDDEKSSDHFMCQTGDC
jgi:hypothetical protein